jgi:hypothetical protein
MDHESLAREIYLMSAKQRTLYNRIMPDRMTPQHHMQLARIATFLTVQSLPESYTERELRTLILGRLRSLMLGRESDFADVWRRGLVRRRPPINACYTWTTWRHYGGTDEYNALHPNRAADISEEAHQEYELRSLQLDTLLPELKSVLTDREYRWLTGRFCDDRNWTDLAVELEVDPHYQGPEGKARAKYVIDTTIRRAKLKAQRYLEARWAARAQEAAA